MSKRKKKTPGHFRVAGRACSTCIYGPNTPQRPGGLEHIEATTLRKGTFINCHTAVLAGTVACCRGFWERHETQALVTVRRLDALGISSVEMVDMDKLEKEAGK